MKKDFLKLFTDCQIVMGKNRAIICDLQRNKYVFIPNSLVSLFDEQGILNLKTVKKELNNEDLSLFKTYLKLLEFHEFIFYCSKDEVTRFPKLNLEFDYPATISNTILDFDRNSNHDLKTIINTFLIPTNCRYIQIRCFDEVKMSFLNAIIHEINLSFLKAADLIIKYSNDLPYDELAKWALTNKKIRSITIHSSPDNKIIQDENYGFSVVVAIKDKITSEKHCGIIHHSTFSINIETFTESQKNNTCLNRKLAIDKKGNLKNCPSTKDTFGNLKNTSLEDVLSNPNLKKYWEINKDRIDICKDCEFRHICTDCRAYIQNPKNPYSKPLKCGYNPYTNEWSDWSVNRLKQNAIKYYGI
ncbi:grasp-with-spasm system SPASM domain peptide maturase [Flavobacterium sp.]|uniref:grasp-with-spasm system SPASM domain peptide maturase n=1 Tax=Flavobacterium sp. TaxID=239 RepID=UPI0026227E7F|nr:grasp-with-spasm system SPASM domain peptide maturase [Flavobacterium sp.]